VLIRVGREQALAHGLHAKVEQPPHRLGLGAEPVLEA
jgi:hypothetical protein